jgi:hypothetical protein
MILALQGIALPAAAEVALFDNRHGDFAWLPQTSTGTPFNYFDPTQPPTQPGEETPFGLTHTNLFPETSTGIAVNGIGVAPEPPYRIAIAVDDSFTVHGSEGAEATVIPATTFLRGESVGPAATWANGADLDWVTYVDGHMPPFYSSPM